MTNEILKPAIALPQPVNVISREGKAEDLLAQLAAHRLDPVLSDELASKCSAMRRFAGRASTPSWLTPDSPSRRDLYHRQRPGLNLRSSTKYIRAQQASASDLEFRTQLEGVIGGLTRLWIRDTSFALLFTRRNDTFEL